MDNVKGGRGIGGRKRTNACTWLLVIGGNSRVVRIGKLVSLKAKKRRLTVNVTLQTYDMYHVCPFNFGITDKKQ